jgi:hypothetical protein
MDSGVLWSQGGTLGKVYANNSIPVGSMVTSIHDKHRQTIEFQVNGKSLGIAFNNIPHENLYAAVDLWLFRDMDDEIRISKNG